VFDKRGHGLVLAGAGLIATEKRQDPGAWLVAMLNSDAHSVPHIQSSHATLEEFSGHCDEPVTSVKLNPCRMRC
jgi:hypothetical protein